MNSFNQTDVVAQLVDQPQYDLSKLRFIGRVFMPRHIVQGQIWCCQIAKSERLFQTTNQ